MFTTVGLLRCKLVCDVKPGLDPCSLLAWSDFLTFIAYKKVKIKFKKAKCVSNRCNDLFKQKKYFGFRCTLNKVIYLVFIYLFIVKRLILTGAISIQNSLTHFLGNLFKTETKNRVVKVRLPTNKYNEGLQPVLNIDQHDMFTIKVAEHSFCACSC